MTARPLAVVWGLGRFGGGLAAATELLRRGYEIRVVDRASRDDLAVSLRSLERENGTVSVYEETPEALEGAEVLCVNPGVHPEHPLLQLAIERKIQLTQELDLFLESYPGRVIGVTGTNGKSSTSAMLARALDAATGRSTLLGGNLGGSLFQARTRWHEDQLCVLEISSFQASRLQLGEPRFDALAITNLTTDHLDWHGGVEEYHAAKLRLLRGLKDGAPAFSSIAIAGLRSDRLVSIEEADTLQLHKDGLRIGDQLVLARSWMGTRGDFQLENAHLALTVIEALGYDVRNAGLGLRGFRGLPHRLAMVGERRGVTFFDNAVSTAAESTRSALQALATEKGRIHLVAGGRAKGSDLSEHDSLAEYPATMHLFGEVAPSYAARLRAAGHDVQAHATMRIALDAAFANCAPGDTLLFSPAFSSFDQFPNFKARARAALAWWHSMGVVDRPGMQTSDRR